MASVWLCSLFAECSCIVAFKHICDKNAYFQKLSQYGIWCYVMNFCCNVFWYVLQTVDHHKMSENSCQLDRSTTSCVYVLQLHVLFVIELLEIFHHTYHMGSQHLGWRTFSGSLDFYYNVFCLCHHVSRTLSHIHIDISYLRLLHIKLLPIIAQLFE